MDRYSEVLLGRESGQFYYIVYCGANATMQAVTVLKYDTDWQVDPEGERSWIQKVGPSYLDGVIIEMNGERVDLQLRSGYAKPAVGHGGIVVVVIALAAEFTYPADLPRNREIPFVLDDANFKGPRSWMQSRAIGLEGVQVEGNQPFQDIDPFNYALLDNQNFLPATRRLDLTVTLPSGTTPDGNHNGNTIPAADSPQLSYGPETFASFAHVEPPNSDPYREVYRTRMILIAGATVLILGSLWIVIQRKLGSRHEHEHD